VSSRARNSATPPIAKRIDSIVSTGTPRSRTNRPQMMIVPNRTAETAADTPPSRSFRAGGS
jgi:hypothetical protein